MALERTGMDVKLLSNSILSAMIPSCRMLKRSPQDEVGGEEKRPRREEPVWCVKKVFGASAANEPKSLDMVRAMGFLPLVPLYLGHNVLVLMKKEI